MGTNGEVTGEVAVEAEFEVSEERQTTDEAVLRHLLNEVQVLTDENVCLTEELSDLKSGFVKPWEARQLERYKSLWGVIVNLVESKDAHYVHHRLRQLVNDELYYIKRGEPDV